MQEMRKFTFKDKRQMFKNIAFNHSLRLSNKPILIKYIFVFIVWFKRSKKAYLQLNKGIRKSEKKRNL